ncbi:hypothetical protein ZWY2020_033685 [Hordeum vulgare]|nr:hypothetical protein ZWY2020_033685 [Hordeum vulgare]
MVIHCFGLAGSSGTYLVSLAILKEPSPADWDGGEGITGCSVAWATSRNRAAAFLQLVKLNKALADAETTIKLKTSWQRKASGISTRRASLKATNYGDAEMGQNIFSFVISVIESAIKVWHDTGKVDAKVNFLLDDQKTHTEKYAPVVNIEKAFESTHTHSSCFAYLRQYSEESFLKAACMVAPKSIISYPQVWKGQGSRKWKLDQSDGFFVQFESPNLRKIWFVASTTEKGRALCSLLYSIVYETKDSILHETKNKITRKDKFI